LPKRLSRSAKLTSACRLATKNPRGERWAGVAMITRQAQIIAYIDDFKLLMIATLAVIPLLRE
jgi:hypothetical protein